MILMDHNGYGSLTDVVSAAGSIMAAGLAVWHGWRKRARFEPSEEDIPKAPARVAGLVTAVIIAVLWLQTRFDLDISFLTRLALGLLVGCVSFLIVYGFLVAVQTYEVIYSPRPNEVASRKIIGGLWMRRHAKKTKRKKHTTTQELLAGLAYDVDKVWSRQARGFAKSVFVLCYLGWNITGTVALACAAILMAAKHG